MAETVTWDGLRELAEFRAEKGCAISLYLDLDPSVVPTAGDADARVSSLLTEGERHAEANSRGLTHDQRVALKARLRRGSATSSRRVRPGRRARRSRSSRPGSTTSGGRARSSSRCPTASGSAGSSISRRSCRSSAAAKARSSPSWAASVGSCSGCARDGWKKSPTAPTTFPAARPGRLVAVPIPAPHREARRRAPARGRRGARPSRAQDALAEGDRRLVGGDARRVRGALSPGDEERDRRLDECRGARLAAGAARADEPDPRGRARTPEAALRRALARGVRAGVVAPPRAGPRRSRRPPTHASRCCSTRKAQTTRPGSAPACGRLSATGGQCPLDGTETDRRDDGLDLTMHQTVAHGGTVWAVTAHEDLDPVGGRRRAPDDTEADGLARTHDSRRAPRPGRARPGHEIAISIDQTLAQDATGTMAMMQFELFGARPRRGRDRGRLRRPQHPPDRLQEPGRPPVPAGDGREVRRLVLAARKRDLPLHPLRALRRPRARRWSAPTATRRSRARRG